ncbi:hypothetical protein RHGRI_007424 [Rhododendron griersonianum]|uniref:Uncharacterized protein n=1 Tax=Rhododendron griersonianum TaxID=479676 RepID=A0AAV6KXI1_9ERIC|nr:hypothetical protein RHGRI_007424 [Rhododendron griersonianum]
MGCASSLQKFAREQESHDATCSAILFLVSSLRQQDGAGIGFSTVRSKCGRASRGAERAQPAIATNRRKGCKDLERKCRTTNCLRGEDGGSGVLE